MAEKRTKVEKEQRKADYLDKKAEGRSEPETSAKKPPQSVRRTA
jgi:hypothetical protein